MEPLCRGGATLGRFEFYTPAVTMYEKRTYDVSPSDIGEVIKLYESEGWPALEAGGFGDYLVGYFISETGTLHQLVHIWRFEDDSARRDFWTRLRQDQSFADFVGKLRPLLRAQDVQLLAAAPWGPTP